jgi:hypothetical protein
LVFGWNTHNALVSEIANFADIQQFMLQLVTFLHWKYNLYGQNVQNFK